MKKLGILFIVGVLLVGNSCQKYLEGINDNPNQAIDASLENLMVAAMVSFLGYNEGEDARLACMWAQQFTGSRRQYSGFNQYIVSTQTFDFFQPYIGVIQTAQLAIGKAEKLDNKVAVGMMKILQGATFGYVASLYGDVPFSEAIQYEQYPTPAYDDQASVYSGAIALIADGIADIQSGEGAIPVDIFGMSESEWVAVGYSYIARFQLHLGNYAEAITAAQNGIQQGGDLIGSHGTAKSGDRNLWYDFIVDERGGYLDANNAFGARIMDPASPEYRGDAKTDESERFSFIYVYVGDTANYEPRYDINVGPDGMFAMDAPYPLITYAETQLIIAESEFRLGNRANALAALNNVRAELRNKFPNGQYDDYDDADLPGNALLDAIILERYKSLTGQTEAFRDVLRLGNPLGLQPTQGSSLPQRFLYPQSEVNSNPNVPDPLPGLFDPLPIYK